MRVPPGLGWFVLALVFLDELLVMAALAVWGADAGGWLMAVLAAASHAGWAIALAVFSVVVNALAMHPDIARLPTQQVGDR